MVSFGPRKKCNHYSFQNLNLDIKCGCMCAKMSNKALLYTLYKNQLKTRIHYDLILSFTREKHWGNRAYHKHRGKFSLKRPTSQAVKAKINKQDYFKIRSFCTAKETLNKVKRQLTEWRQIFSNYVTDKRLIFGTYKVFQELNNKIIQLRKKAKNMNK